MSKVYGIGVGPGDPELVTVKAVKILKTVDVIAVPFSNPENESIALNIVKEYIKQDVDIVHLHFPMVKDVNERNRWRENNAEIIRKKLLENKTIAVITLGDPLFYSTFIYLMDFIDKDKIEIIPGITSINSVAAQHKIPLSFGGQNICIISNISKFNTDLTEFFHTFVFMKVSTYTESLYTIIKEHGWDDFFYMISSSSTKHQKISTQYQDLIHDTIDYMTTVIIKGIP